MLSEPDRRKLDVLAARIHKAEEAADPNRKFASVGMARSGQGMVRAIRIGSDFVAAVVVPTLAGGYLDHAWDTAPWCMLSLLVIGFIVGFWGIVRALSGKSSQEQGKG